MFLSKFRFIYPLPRQRRAVKFFRREVFFRAVRYEISVAQGIEGASRAVRYGIYLDLGKNIPYLTAREQHFNYFLPLFCPWRGSKKELNSPAPPAGESFAHGLGFSIANHYP